MNLLIEAVSPVVLTYSPEGLLTFGILSHTYRYKVTSWSHNLVIAHTVFDSGSLAGILMSEPTAKSYVKRTCMFVLSIATFTFTFTFEACVTFFVGDGMKGHPIACVPQKYFR